MKAFVRFDGHEFVELLPEDFTRDEYETLLQEFQVPTGHCRSLPFKDIYCILLDLPAPSRADF